MGLYKDTWYGSGNWLLSTPFPPSSVLESTLQALNFHYVNHKDQEQSLLYEPPQGRDQEWAMGAVVCPWSRVEENEHKQMQTKSSVLAVGTGPET
ncbi:Trifunctional Purine Biosynthetic Protein Adenosine-3 [Manis pentadactyla]|nr:Trifunctional Purine Biosynthetic Protein Adenosine-3 [Manis pentadactyla]